MATPPAPCPAPDIAALQERLARSLAAPLPIARTGAEAERRAREVVARQRTQIQLTGAIAAALATRQKDLAKLHISRKDLRLDEETAQAMIARVSGGRTQSAGELTAPERTALLEELRRGGWTPRRGLVRRVAPAETKAALIAKVRALLLDAGRPDEYANAIARSRFKVSIWEWLPWGDLKKLTQMLVIDQERRATRIAAPGDGAA